MQILNFSHLFVADAPMKIIQKISFTPSQEHFWDTYYKNNLDLLAFKKKNLLTSPCGNNFLVSLKFHLIFIAYGSGNSPIVKSFCDFFLLWKTKWFIVELRFETRITYLRVKYFFKVVVFHSHFDYMNTTVSTVTTNWI